MVYPLDRRIQTYYLVKEVRKRVDEDKFRKRMKMIARDGPQMVSSLKDLLSEKGSPEEERELTPEMSEMIREYIYNFSKMYLQVLREENSSR